MGRRHTDTSRSKISEALKGRVPWNKGTTTLPLCDFCKINRIKRGSHRWCSRVCQRDHNQRDRIDKWKSGEPTASNIIRKWLIRVLDGKCSICLLNGWMGKPLVVELEHKDGNSDNNSPDNVCLLCPNCHSQTPTYKSKNKGKGRHFRRVRYAQGKVFSSPLSFN